VAIAMMVDNPEGSQEIYDRIRELVGLDEPAGGIFHVAGPSPNGGWRVIEVWESEEDAQRFLSERLRPAFEAVGGVRSAAAVLARARLHHPGGAAMNYKFMYAIGFHPWEDDAAEGRPFAEKASELFHREESGREPPYGSALDLGCGSGIWAVQLAKRGWQVTGVDNVDKALERARERVKGEGVDVRLVKGDLTNLRVADVGSGFRLLVDNGAFHSLNPAQHEAMSREVSAVAADDATLLLVAWTPKRRGPLPRGASRREIESAFHGWTVTDVEPSGIQAPKPIELLMKPDEHWYRLRRK